MKKIIKIIKTFLFRTNPVHQMLMVLDLRLVQQLEVQQILELLQIVHFELEHFLQHFLKHSLEHLLRHFLLLELQVVLMPFQKRTFIFVASSFSKRKKCEKKNTGKSQYFRKNKRKTKKN